MFIIGWILFNLNFSLNSLFIYLKKIMIICIYNAVGTCQQKSLFFTVEGTTEAKYTTQVVNFKGVNYIFIDLSI